MKRITFLITLFSLAITTCHAQSSDDEKYEQANNYYKAKEYDKAVPILKELADKNHAKALCQLGFLFERGYGVTQDIKKSLEYTRKSAELGWMVAQHNLGWYYQNGFGTVQDYKKALYWYEKASKQGYAGSYTNMGVMYEKGLGVVQDLNISYEYYLKAAEKGEPKGQVYLGCLFYNNKEFEKLHPEYDMEFRMKQSEKWFRLAAKQEDVEGVYYLACHFDRIIDEMNYMDEYEASKLSRKLFEKSAEQGYVWGEACWAYLCFENNNMDLAKYWFNKASANNPQEVTLWGYRFDIIYALFNFFMDNSDYEIFRNSDRGSTFFICPERDYVYVSAISKRNKKMGIIKLSEKGKILAHTPFIYEHHYPDYDQDKEYFHVTLKNEGEEYGHEVTIDISGKEKVKEP